MEGNLISKLALLLVASLSRTAGQPVGCTDDGQCGTGYYCVKDMCRSCLKCEDFKRNPPLIPTKCITSVSDCGRCFDGLVESVQGDLLEPCVPDNAGTQLYLWVAIGLAIFVLVAVAVAVVISRLKMDIPRILASTRTSVQSGCVNGAVATAPELPPAYNTLYNPERPDSPATQLSDEGHKGTFTMSELTGIPQEKTTVEKKRRKKLNKSARPFIKQPPPPVSAREAAGNQEANYYYNPNYVRGPHLPSNHAAERDPEPEFLQDETTVESPWTPNDSTNNNTTDENSESSSSGAASASSSMPMSAALAAARNTALLRPPCQDAATPNKQPRLRQDTNNNRNNRDSDDDAPLPRPAAGGATVNILVNVQQLNDVKLS